MDKTSMQIFYAPISMTESRLVKSCHSIISLKLVDKIFVIGYWEKGMELKSHISKSIQVIRIKTLLKSVKFRKGLFRKFIAVLSFMEYHLSVIKLGSKIKPDFISCHNLQLLPLCVLVKYLYKGKLFYEPHELETEKTGLNKRSKSVAKFLEKLFIKYCDRVVTVCEPITDFYKEQYKLDDSTIITIRNVPVNPNLGERYRKTDLFRSEFKIPEESVIFLYQGLIDKYRGILNYLETFTKLDNNFHLILMGYGDDESLAKEYSKKHCNIHFKPAVPVNEIIKYTSSADVGLFVIPGNLSLSYRYALPNKFYEYAIAGMHICVSDNFHLLKKIVEEQKLGSVIPSTTSGLYEWIKSNGTNKEKLLSPSSKSLEFRKNCGWQNEERYFFKLYS